MEPAEGLRRWRRGCALDGECVGRLARHLREELVQGRAGQWMAINLENNVASPQKLVLIGSAIWLECGDDILRIDADAQASLRKPHRNLDGTAPRRALEGLPVRGGLLPHPTAVIAPNNTEHRDTGTGTVFTCTGTFGGVRPMRQCRHTGNKKEVTFVSRRSLTASRLRVPSSFYLSYWYCYSSRVPPYRSPYTELINNKQHTACQANTANFIRMIATANSGPPTYSELTHLYVDFSTGLL